MALLYAKINAFPFRLYLKLPVQGLFLQLCRKKYSIQVLMPQ